MCLSTFEPSLPECQCPCVHVPMCPCVHVPMRLPSWNANAHVPMCPAVHVPMCPCTYLPGMLMPMCLPPPRGWETPQLETQGLVQPGRLLCEGKEDQPPGNRQQVRLDEVKGRGGE